MNQEIHPNLTRQEVPPPKDRSDALLAETHAFMTLVFVIECVALYAGMDGASNNVLVGVCCGGLAAVLLVSGTLCVLSRVDDAGKTKRFVLLGRAGISDTLFWIWLGATLIAMSSTGFRADTVFLMWIGCTGAIAIGCIRCFTGATLAIVDSNRLRARVGTQQTGIQQMFIATTAFAVATLVTRVLLGKVASDDANVLFVWTSVQITQMIGIVLVMLRTHISLVLLIFLYFVCVQVFNAYFFTEFRSGRVSNPDIITSFHFSLVGHSLLFFAMLRTRGCRWMLSVKKTSAATVGE